MRSIVGVFLFGIIVISFQMHSQTSRLDTLLNKIKEEKIDTSISKLYLRCGYAAVRITFDSGMYYGNKALDHSKKIGFKKGMADAYYLIGLCYQFKGDYYNNNLFAEKALAIYKSINQEQKVYDCYTLIGNGYTSIGNLEKGLEYHFKSLKGREKMKDTSGIGLSLMNIGRAYRLQNEYKKAVEYYSQSLSIGKKKRNYRSVANCLNNISNVYFYQKQYDSAITYQFLSLKVNIENGYSEAAIVNYVNIANNHISLKRNDSASKYYNIALVKAKAFGDNESIATCYEGIGSIYLEQKQYAKALDNFKKALEIANETKAIEYMVNLYKNVAEASAFCGNYKEAYEAFRNHKVYYDTLFSQNNTKNLTETRLKYDFEKQQDREKAENLRKELIQTEKSKNLQQLIYFFCFAFAIVLVLLFISIRNYRLKQKVNLELELKNTVIEEKNRDITDSIKYAKRLQDAILPSTHFMSKCFKEVFVLFKPKDIVSGDLYWMEKIDHTVFFAVVDCTGHGVPGAFMSIMAHNLIQQAIHEKHLKDPADILNYINTALNEKLNKEDVNRVNDGMDIAMCAFNTKTSEIKYSGANNPLWIVNTNGELVEIDPDKASIGFQNNETFSQKIKTPEKGSMVYLFSDGYADQFGGKKGKKLMKKTLKGILQNICKLEINDQKTALSDKLEEWRGNLHQVDDVCVMGIRV